MRHPSINGLAKFFNRLHHGLPAKYVDAGSLVLKGRLLPNAQCVLYQRPRVRPAGHDRASVVREHCAARASRRTAPKLNERRVNSSPTRCSVLSGATALTHLYRL